MARVVVPFREAPPQPAAPQPSTPTLTLTPTVTLSPTVTPTLTPSPTPVVYVVGEGDTLFSISLEYGVPLGALLEANGLEEGSLLRIGQQLVIPRPTPTPGPLGPAATPTPTPQAYVVEEGDTLLGIATQFDVTLSSLLEANGLTERSLLSVGQELVIPAPTPTPTPEPSQATPTPLALPTRDPALRYDAPPLLWPPNGARIQGGGLSVLLSWVSVGILADDEHYVVELSWTADGVARDLRRWTKATAWRVPEELFPGPAGASFEWQVVVRRQTGVNLRGEPVGLQVGAPSERRSFLWVER